ncbi:MAG: DctP family TRAP transporter solute-binding subunit [Thermodesulfobacteriota bacterium]
MRKLLCLALAAALACALPAAASARSLTLAVVTKPGSAQNVAAGQLASLLEAFSGGDFQVEILDSGRAGDESQILEKIRKGSLDMAVVTAGPFDAYNVLLGVIGHPFLFSDYAQADAVLQGALGDEILADLEGAGFVGLAFSENGFRNLTNNKRPVKSPGDLSGLRIRVMESPLQQDLWQALGATPVPLPWPIDKALADGAVDGQENPLWVVDEYGLYRVQKYMTLTRHVYSPHVVVAGKKLWERLSDRERGLVTRAAREAAAYQRGENRAQETKHLEDSLGHGMQVEEKPDIAAFRQKAAALEKLPYYQQARVHSLLSRIRSLIAVDSRAGGSEASQKEK